MTTIIQPSSFIPDYSGLFGDTRLEKRGKNLWSNLNHQKSSSIRRVAENPSEQKAFYRFLHNENVSEQDLIFEAKNRLSKIVSGRHLLCIQDTSEINLSTQRGRIKPNTGLGRSDKSDTAHCFKIHPGFVLDANDLSPLGFSHIKIFHCPEEMPDRNTRKYKQMSIEEKETFKWIEVAQESKITLKDADLVTFIEDREGDIFEQFARIPDKNFELLIRSRTTRRLLGDKDLYDEIENEEIAGTYTISVPTDKRKNQYKREALVQLRYKCISIKRPKNLSKKLYPETIELTCVSVKEVGNVNKPISWKLLTTHKVKNFEQALLIVSWYGVRWFIEQLFRMLKKQGFGIEESEMESGWAMRKLVIMQMTVILKIFQMQIAYSQPEEGQLIMDIFSEEEIEILKIINQKYQGRTAKLQNQNNPERTKWATWIIGKLGGWKGYDSQGPPGVVALNRGLERFNHMVEGIKLIKDVSTR